MLQAPVAPPVPPVSSASAAPDPQAGTAARSPGGAQETADAAAAQAAHGADGVPPTDMPPGSTASGGADPGGVMGPFQFAAFRMIWIANLFANFGVWAQSVAAAWVITDAPDTSAVLVAMIQVAAAVPLVVLSIVTGVLADNYDRRRIMLLGMSVELVIGLSITVLAFLGRLEPVTLIVATFIVSIGGAVVTPAWQAAVGEQVPKSFVGRAVLLNSVNYNVARALGPALGGVMLGTLGAPWVFLFNCICYAALIWAIWRWRRVLPRRSLPPERIVEGVVAALRFTEFSTVTRLVMMRAFMFGISASALWALLPLLAHAHPDGSASLYGYMLGALGLGAIGGSVLIGRVQRRVGVSRLVSGAAALFALCLMLMGLTDNLALVFPALLASGACWIAVLATYNTTVQLLVPDWVKARALALYQTAIFGGLALGSFAWGHFAGTMGVQGAMGAAGIALLVTVLLLYRSRLPDQADARTLATLPSTRPDAPADFDPHHGAVLLTIEYLVEPDRAPGFVAASRSLRLMRLRNGADQWQLFRDLEQPGVWREVFVIGSWIQYLRMNDRMTLADRMVLDAAQAFHAGPQPPRVTHGVSYLALAAMPRAGLHATPIPVDAEGASIPAHTGSPLTDSPPPGPDAGPSPSSRPHPAGA